MNAATVRRQNASVTEPQRDKEPLAVFFGVFLFAKLFLLRLYAQKKKRVCRL